MSKALSPTMAEAVAEIRDLGGIVHRYMGGYWTREHAAWNGNAPAGWYTGTSTIEALVARGILEYVEWKEGKKRTFPIAAKLIGDYAE